MWYTIYECEYLYKYALECDIPYTSVNAYVKAMRINEIIRIRTWAKNERKKVYSYFQYMYYKGIITVFVDLNY